MNTRVSRILRCSISPFSLNNIDMKRRISFLKIKTRKRRMNLGGRAIPLEMKFLDVEIFLQRESLGRVVFP